jgi:hypothetical protein
MLPVLASSKFFAFRTEVNGKYLQSVYREDGGSRIEASAGTIIADQRAWFFVEPSRKGGFLHVRSCYNNKYWVPVQDSGRWIIGTADEPKEDMSKPTSCTLFQALPVKDKDNSIRLVMFPYLVTSFSRIILVHVSNPRKIQFPRFFFPGIS